MTPTIGKHAFSGWMSPKENPVFFRAATFSVGIFEWRPSLTKRPKRSKVKVRVAGKTSDHEAVYAKAREIVAELDAGTYTGPKRVAAAATGGEG